MNLDGFIISETSYTAIPNIIEETKDTTVISTILQEAEVSNRNLRIYDKDALYEALNSPMVREKIQKKAFFGEAGHPLSDDLKRQTYIDQTRISHIVTQLKFENNLIKGVVESARTRCGQDFRGLIQQGTGVAFSMRGLGGATKKEGKYTRIGKPLHIIGYDWVVYPSHSNAYLEKIIKEDTEINNGNSLILSEGKIINFNMNELAEYVSNESRNVKELAESNGFEIRSNNVSIDKNLMLSIKEGQTVLKVFLEDYIKRELDQYYINL